MDRLFIFAVGGTGARVMKSLTMLMSTGALSNYEVVPILVDFDTHNGNLNQTLKLMRMYEGIHEKSYDNCNPMHNEGYFSSPLTPITSLTTPSDMAFGKGNYPSLLDMPLQYTDLCVCHLLDYHCLQGNEFPFRLLLDSLFTTDSSGEIYQDLRVGFKGNAKIARLGYAEMKIHGSIEFKTLLQCYVPHKDKVVVIGSTFGATGSVGVIEILKQLIYNRLCPHDNLATVFVEPYFLPKPSLPFGVVDVHSLLKRSQNFLRFFKESGIAATVGTTYKIGMDGFAIVDFKEGGVYQQNKAHIVELLSAMAICEYATTGQQGTFNYCIGKNNFNNNHNISLPDFCKFPNGYQTFKSLAKHLLTAKFFMEFKHGNPKIKSAYFYRNIQHRHSILPTDINDMEFAFSEYLEWLNELSFDNQNVYGLDIFNVKDPMDNVINGHPYIRRSLFRRDIMKEFVERMNQNYAELDRKGHIDSISPNQLLLKLFFNSSCDLFKLFNC